MPPRRRPQFTQESVEQQLQQIHLLDQSSSSENLEQLGPIIKQIHTNRQQDAYLRTLQGLIDSKDAEIEKICGDNYQDFISSVSTLFTVKSYTHDLRDKIATLDSSVSQIGHGVAEKKRALLQSKKTATNLDEAIDSLQASLRILDVVDRVGEMVREGKYWSALRVCDPFTFVYSLLNNLTISSPWMTFRACPNHPYLRPHYFSIYSCRSPLCAGKSRTLSQPRQSSGCWKSVTSLAKWGNLLSRPWRAEHGVGGPAERRIPCYDSVGLAVR